MSEFWMMSASQAVALQRACHIPRLNGRNRPLLGQLSNGRAVLGEPASLGQNRPFTIA